MISCTLVDSWKGEFFEWIMCLLCVLHCIVMLNAHIPLFCINYFTINKWWQHPGSCIQCNMLLLLLLLFLVLLHHNREERKEEKNVFTRKWECLKKTWTVVSWWWGESHRLKLFHFQTTLTLCHKVENFSNIHFFL